VKFAEVDRTALTQIGFNVFSTGAGNTIGTISTGSLGLWRARHHRRDGRPDRALSDKETSAMC